MTLPPIFERVQESNKRFTAYRKSAEGREASKRWRVGHFSHIISSVGERLRLRELAEQRERFHAYRAANPPRHTNQ